MTLAQTTPCSGSSSQKEVFSLTGKSGELESRQRVTKTVSIQGDIELVDLEQIVFYIGRSIVAYIQFELIHEVLQGD
jgi:hypothetical protein